LQEVQAAAQVMELPLAYRWFCRLDLDDKVPDHSTFSVNRHGRFREWRLPADLRGG
jgi:IS5 family transposase